MGVWYGFSEPRYAQCARSAKSSPGIHLYQMESECCSTDSGLYQKKGRHRADRWVDSGETAG